MTPRGNSGVTSGADYTLTINGHAYSGSFERVSLKSDAQKEVTRTSVGDALSKTAFDTTEEKATFTFVTTVNPFVPDAVYSLGTVATNSTKANTYLTGSNWLLEDYRIDDSNTSARRCEYDMSRNANITS